MASPRRTTALLLVLATVTVALFGISVIRRSRANKPATMPPILASDPQRGGVSPQVTIIEYGDFACPFCAEMSESLAAVERLYPNQIRRVWKDVPTAEHAEANPAARAARCAQQQGRFWEFHDALFTRQAELGSALYTSLVEQFKLDPGRYEQCLADPAVQQAIDRSQSQSEQFGIASLPTVFVNEQRFEGALTEEELTAIIQAELAAQ